MIIPKSIVVIIFIIGEIENGWNLTFWNESKGCEGKCIIRKQIQFNVNMNGSVVKVGEYEVMITLEDILEESIKFPDIDERNIE